MRFFRNGHFDQLKQLFADQFTLDGRDYIYRKSMKGAAIRVTAQERDAFIADFARRIRYASWMLVGGTIGLIALLVFFDFDRGTAGADIALYGGFAMMMAIFWLGYLWAWNAPVRTLERRPEVGEALTGHEARRQAFERMTYGQLGLGLLAPFFILLQVSKDYDLFYKWNRLWLIGAGVFVLLVAVQAFRKWRYTRPD